MESLASKQMFLKVDQCQPYENSQLYLKFWMQEYTNNSSSIANFYSTE